MSDRPLFDNLRTAVLADPAARRAYVKAVTEDRGLDKRQRRRTRRRMHAALAARHDGDVAS